jgi:hypothetical protein
MNIQERVNSLPFDDRVVFKQMTDGVNTPEAAYLKSKELRESLTANGRPPNHKGIALAMEHLYGMYQTQRHRGTPADPEVQKAKLLAHAQSLRAQGLDYQAERYLAPHGLTLDNLRPRPANAGLEAREANAKAEYTKRRADQISKMSLHMDPKAAETAFDGKQVVILPDGTQGERKKPGNLDDALRKDINLANGFPADRPF